MKTSHFFQALLFGAAFFMLSGQLTSQNITITDDDTYTPDESAVLDVKSTDKGLLVPRMTTTQREAISSPATGLLVFDTNESCFFYYSGASGWLNLTTKVIKPASATVDSALFCVVNGMDTIFAVYPEGVRFQVGNGDAKGAKGGFAVGGLTSGGKSTEEYLQVFRDSVRVYVNPATKGAKGGFAVGGLNSKGDTDFLKITKDNYFIGHESGLNNTTGLYNVFMGYQTGYTNDASYNTFLGYKSGFANSSGAWNVFLGYESGLSNSTGDWNVFVGHQAGNSNTTGQRNVFLGQKSGFSNKSGVANVFIGSSAGYSDTISGGNVYIGEQAGFYSQGSWNVFIGAQSGRDNTTGDNNVFLGGVSGQYNTTGSRNIFIGHYNGYNNTTGIKNTYVGSYAGVYNQTGSSNSFFGDGSGRNNKGSGNVFLGFESGYNKYGSNNLIIENSSTDSTNALIYGRFDEDSLWLNADVRVKYDLEIGEGFTVGNTTKSVVGTIRWNGLNFQGYKVGGWVNLDYVGKKDDLMKKYVQETEPDIPTNASAFWVDDNGNYYLILDHEGKQKKLLMND